MVEGGMTCVKYLVFAFNLLFLLFGALLIGLGAYVWIALKDYLDFFSGSVSGPAIVLIVFGAITFIVAFFGCCGAIKENHCMTMTFAALITIILICELGAGIAGYVLRGKVETWLTDGMKDSMNNYDEKDGVTATWDKVQQELKCCGSTDSADWLKLGKAIPDSCYKDKVVAPLNLFGQGCFKTVEDNVMKNIIIVAGAGIGIAVVEILGIILSCCLARSIKSEYEVA